MNPTRRRAARRPLIALAVPACAALFAAAPAQAGGEFRDGFEDQLGRLAALEVFHVGHVLLYGAAGPYSVAYVERYAPPPRPHRHHAKHPGRHGRHHRHAAPCWVGHSHGPKRGHYERIAVVERPVYRRHVVGQRRGGY